jgi:DNA-binding NtrC family response regulator
VRELENAMQHAVALHHGDVIEPDALPQAIHTTKAHRSIGTDRLPELDTDQFPPLTEAKRRATAQFEKAYLEKVMLRANGSVSEAARLSGLDRTNFRRLLQRHAIDPAVFR